MATYTTNYNLKKPGYADAADVADFNSNFDTIDTELKEKDTRVGALTSLTTTVKTSIVNAINELVTSLGLKAPLASPIFTGTPAAPTATTGTNTTQIATTAFVNAEIANDAVPLARTVNGKALSSNITLAQVDIGGVETLLKSASFELALTDNYDLLKCVSSSTITITIPTNASVAFPVGSEIVIARYGAGAVTLSPASGVTLYSSDSKKSINKQYEFATLKKIATDEWVLLGSLSA